MDYIDLYRRSATVSRKGLVSRVLVFGVIFFSLPNLVQSQLIKNLKHGDKQVLVIYGTSLSAFSGGPAWVNEVGNQLNLKFHGLLTVYNAAKSGMWSTWGVQHVEDSVISKHPNAVMIEFSINDAYLAYHTSPELARLNLNYMIDRIKLYNPQCQVILQIMDIPINENAINRPNLAAYTKIYRQVARERKLLLIDHSIYWKNILAKGKDVYLKYVPDGIHPDVKSGREIIAPFILKALGE